MFRHLQLKNLLRNPEMMILLASLGGILALVVVPWLPKVSGLGTRYEAESIAVGRPCDFLSSRRKEAA